MASSQIHQIQEMGFSPQEAENALQITNGNVEQALNFLLSGGEMPQSSNTNSESVTTANTQDISSFSNQSLSGEIVQSETSQFTFGIQGRSACTAISCEAAIILMTNHTTQEEVTPELIHRIIEAGVEIYTNSQSTQGEVEHMAVDEILPLVDRFMNHLRKTSDISIQGLLTNPECFLSIIEQARQGQVDPTQPQPIALVITKPPETVVVIIPPNSEGMWYLFDSHSRPQYGINGGYIIACSMNQLVDNLKTIFPSVNLDGDLQGTLMAEMYNSVEAVPMQLSTATS